MHVITRLLDALGCLLFPLHPPLSPCQKHPKVALAVARAQARLIRKGRGGVIRVAAGGRVTVRARSAFGPDGNAITVDDANYFGDRHLPGDRCGRYIIDLPKVDPRGVEGDPGRDLLTPPPAPK